MEKVTQQSVQDNGVESYRVDRCILGSDDWRP
jgi:hypothetical protein